MLTNILSLERFPEYANTTPGRFIFDGKTVCYSIELPFCLNAHDTSCIPKGLYTIAYTKSQKFQRVLLEIKSVPNRDGIRVHSANYSHELQGCIAPVTMLKIINSKMLMGTSSVNALKVLDNVVKKYKVTTLEIF